MVAMPQANTEKTYSLPKPDIRIPVAVWLDRFELSMH